MHTGSRHTVHTQNQGVPTYFWGEGGSLARKKGVLVFCRGGGGKGETALFRNAGSWRGKECTSSPGVCGRVYLLSGWDSVQGELYPALFQDFCGVVGCMFRMWREAGYGVGEVPLCSARDTPLFRGPGVVCPSSEIQVYLFIPLQTVRSDPCPPPHHLKGEGVY